MTNIINGKEISDKFLKKLKKEVCNLKTELNLQPALAVIIVGDDPA